MNKRFKVTLFLALLWCPVYLRAEPLWEYYKSHFISQDGRIIDYYQNRVSHSEGQGYGMLLSILYRDRSTFYKVWRWTRNNLLVRGDNLLAWRWGERFGGRWEVIDYNNATDGDILVAFALIKASEIWHEDSYKKEGLRIIKDIREKLAFKWRDYLLLLPGYYGFIKDGNPIINPSYFIFPAYRCFAEVDKRGFWERIYKDSASLLSKIDFTPIHLPADWVVLGKDGITPFSEKSKYFGYEAIRILLYLSWEKDLEFPKGAEKILDFYRCFGYIPLWVDLLNESISLKSAPSGFYAIFARIAQRKGEKELSKELFLKAQNRIRFERDDYYSFTLYLLSEREVKW